MTQKLPAQLVAGAKRPSFAFATANERWPKIITGIVDKLHQSYNPTVAQQGQKAGDDVNSVIAKLSEMRYLLMTDKPLEPFGEDVPDASVWNDELQALSKANGDKPISWYSGPWLFVECYMYRKVQEFLEQTQHLRSYDPFWEDKEKGYKNSSKYMLAMGTELVHLLENSKMSAPELRISLLRLIQICLWGNKCDLSLTGGDPHSMSATIFHELEELRANILADDLEAVVNRHLLAPSVSKRVDFVLDNAGLELFTDFCMADFLLAKGLAAKCVMHGKQFPWFVSDATKRDVEWMLEQLAADPDPFLNKLGTRWRNNFNQGIFEYTSHPFWTQGFEYSRMEEKASDLYGQLSGSALLIFKGDLNYRKLVGDREWPLQTAFAESLCGFGPAPLLALRTLKAETCSGLSADALKKISSKFGEDDTGWMVSSDYAVAQLFEPRR